MNAQSFEIVPKGVALEIKDKETGSAYVKLYVGAGWDMGNRPVDLDLVAACLSNGKLLPGGSGRLVYFGDKTEPGIQLSEDNTTGAGDGDDESLVIDLSKVESDVDSIAIGVCAYSGADLSSASNFHFRIVNGDKETDPQVFDVKTDDAKSGETVLHAATLKRGANDTWTIENVSAFYARGNGTDAIKGFANLFA